MPDIAAQSIMRAEHMADIEDGIRARVTGEDIGREAEQWIRGD